LFFFNKINDNYLTNNKIEKMVQHFFLSSCDFAFRGLWEKIKNFGIVPFSPVFKRRSICESVMGESLQH
jgi:hypothetical protein